MTNKVTMVMMMANPVAILQCLSSLAVVMTAVIWWWLVTRSQKKEKNLPPGSMGWPVIGESIEFLFGKPEKFVLERMRKYSPDIFKTKILGEKTAVICGPNGHKFLFSNEHKYFTAFRPHSMQRIFRSYSKEATTKPAPSREEEAKVLRSPGFLKPEALVRYLGKMESVTREHVRAHWEGKAEVEAYPLAKTLTLTLACRLFLGTERTARLVRHFDAVAVGMHSLLLDVPGTAFRRAAASAAAIRSELRCVIAEKRAALASGVASQDVLAHMVVATDAAGRHMGDAEVADKVMGLLTAGYSTVATAMAFFMKRVGENPDVYDKVLAEQLALRKKNDQALEWEDMSKMKYTWNVVNEVMRLTPPLQGTFREALEEFSYGGYTVPKGWKVYWTVSSTNMNPDLFPSPERFDPSRYDGGSPLPPFAFAPFGGGPRMCPGKEYARLAILTFVHVIVTSFRWELVVPGEKVVGDMMPTPQQGLPIRIFPH